MCKYCDGSHEYHILEDKEMDAFVRDDNALEIQICFFDEIRQTKMVSACAPVINYCPWCGKKLTNL